MPAGDAPTTGGRGRRRKWRGASRARGSAGGILESAVIRRRPGKWIGSSGLRPALFSQASNEKSSAPVTPAQFSSPGFALISATSSAIEFTGSTDGTEMPTTVLEIRAIGELL